MAVFWDSTTYLAIKDFLLDLVLFSHTFHAHVG
jgi:hypothetical protein